MKYTFEIMKEYEDAFKGISVYSVSDDKKLMVDFVALEELEDAQKRVDEAYQRGINDGSLDVKQRVEGAYQRGLDEAWECARKLFSTMSDSDIEKAFPIEWNNGGFNALMNLQPQKAIEKLKAYEEKQKADDEIKVGDEVKWNSDLIVVTRLYKDGGFDWCDGISKDGRAFHVLEENVSKTSRHFDILKILGEMKE